MSDDTEDLVVKARLRTEIESSADALRRRQQTHGPIRDIVQLLISEIGCPFSPLHGWKLVERPDAEMPDEEAYADFSTRELAFRTSVLAGAERGVNRYRMTVAHEMGHVVLEHQHGRLRRMQDGNKEFKFGRRSESAEWQARYFAAALLMPRELVKASATIGAVASTCNVSIQAAEIRFDEINVRGKAKHTPEDIKADIKELRASVQQGDIRPTRSTVLPLEIQMKLSWELAPKHSDHDPDKFRVIDDRYVVMKSRFGWAMVGGWTIEGDKIVPWESRNP